MAFLLSSLRLGLWKQSIVRCADNTGIIKAVIIGLGQNKWGTGKIGDRIRVSVRDKHDFYKGEQMPKAIIARTRKDRQGWELHQVRRECLRGDFQKQGEGQQDQGPAVLRDSEQLWRLPGLGLSQ
ncbi:unnamed protein product [Effrenium voratum]|nr:unnamed protein product [Effrenium voratum]